ncbi:MAG: amidohydrolase [bacterium]|nr:amidohydrolase [bacterium]
MKIRFSRYPGWVLLLVLLLPIVALADPDFKRLALDQEEQILEDRRHLHQYPELSLREFETQAYLLAALERIPGVTLVEGDWGTGVVAILEGGRPGPLVAWRTDMDGLPVTETTGLPFASTRRDTVKGGKQVGVMHACGHDCHMSAALGIIRALSEVRAEMPGRVLFIGEPAEEIGAGAKRLLRAGIFEDGRKPRVVLGMHVHPTLELGTVGFCPGWATGNVDRFRLVVKGDGGHGAYPHLGVDPVTLAARMVLAFQSLISREINVNSNAVISVGLIEGGAKSNVIPDEVVIEATVRTHDQDTRLLVKGKIERTVQGLAMAAGAPEPELDYHLGTIAGYNDPELVEQVRAVIRRQLGDGMDVRYVAGLGGEDFAYFGQRVPGFQYRVGVVSPDDPVMNLHKGDFDPDERALVISVEVGAAAIWDQLQRGQ